MKRIQYLMLTALLLGNLWVFAQKKNVASASKQFPVPTLTIEPGLGIAPMPMTRIVLGNLIQWNPKKRLSLLSLTSVNFNGPYKRNFNYITTNYNISVGQKLGIGTSVYTRHSAHTFSLVAGIKYDAYKETLNNPEFETVTVSRNTISPDFGLLYNGKMGQKKFFFSYRMYVPLYPYPVRGLDISSINGNLSNISLELGLGIRLR